MSPHIFSCILGKSVVYIQKKKFYTVDVREQRLLHANGET